MSAGEDRRPPEAARARVGLGLSAVLGAAAWSLDLLGSYALVHRTRETGSKAPLALVSVVALVLLAIAAVLAWRTLRALPAGEPAHRTWRRLAGCVLVFHGFLLLVLAGQAIPKLLLVPWD